jgi:HEAT repeat protein
LLQVRSVIHRLLAKEPFGKKTAIERLGGPNPAFKSLCRYLRLPDRLAIDRQWAAILLGECGERSVPVLIKSLDDESREVRWCAAVALGEIGPPARGSLPKLITLYAESDGAYGEDLSGAIDSVGPGTQDLLPEMIVLLGHDSQYVRQGASFELARMGKAGIEVTDALERARKGGNARVRDAAAEALERLKKPLPVEPPEEAD